MTSPEAPTCKKKNHSRFYSVLALRSLSLELINEDAEKYPPKSTETRDVQREKADCRAHHSTPTPCQLVCAHGSSGRRWSILCAAG